MTLVLGLRCLDGAVLAADSQRTEGALADAVPKLFTSGPGIVWGTAGAIPIQQELYAKMRDLPVDLHPAREQARDAIVTAVVAARQAATAHMDEAPAAMTVDGLFAWYSAADRRTYLLRVRGDGYGEFCRKYTAVSATPGDNARFALRGSEYLGYATLPMEPAKIVAFNVADDVIRAASGGVAPPIQMAVVTAAQTAVLTPLEVGAVEDTVAAFREHQRDFLLRREPATVHEDTGVRP